MDIRYKHSQAEFFCKKAEKVRFFEHLANPVDYPDLERRCLELVSEFRLHAAAVHINYRASKNTSYHVFIEGITGRMIRRKIMIWADFGRVFSPNVYLMRPNRSGESVTIKANISVTKPVFGRSRMDARLQRWPASQEQGEEVGRDA